MKPYNERLYGTRFRAKWHLARYEWFKNNLKRENPDKDFSVMELGCFDGKTLNYFPTAPSKYVGFDANWDNGLDLARERWKNHPNYSFEQTQTPEELHGEYDIAVCMETLEHVPLNMHDKFIEKLSNQTKKVALITVPVEKGPIVLGKHIVKKLILGEDSEYTNKEIFWALLGKLNKVPRSEFNHKGYDYNQTINAVKKNFREVRVESIPFRRLPLFLGNCIGIIARK